MKDQPDERLSSWAHPHRLTTLVKLPPPQKTLITRDQSHEKLPSRQTTFESNHPRERLTTLMRPTSQRPSSQETNLMNNYLYYRPQLHEQTSSWKTDHHHKRPPPQETLIIWDLLHGRLITIMKAPSWVTTLRIDWPPSWATTMRDSLHKRPSSQETNLMEDQFLHLHLSLNCGGHRGTIDDFTTSFLHFSLFTTALSDLVTLMLSSPVFFCLPCLLPHFTVLARWFWPDQMNGRQVHTTSICVSLWWAGLCVVQLPAGSWHGLPCW